MKKLLPVLILVLVVLGICLCQDGTFDKISGNSFPEEQLAADIAANSSDIKRCGLAVTDVNVLSSEQDKELDLYSCKVEYTAENDEIKYFGNMSLKYMKANDTWRLTDCDEGEISYEPKKACDKSVAIDYMNAEYAKLTKHDSGDYYYEVASEDYGYSYGGVSKSYCFVFNVTGQENGIVSWTDSWTIYCIFDIRDGWKVESGERTHQSENWDVCGTYTYSNDKVSISVNISSFKVDLSSNSATVTYSWELTAYKTDDYRWQITPLNTKLGDGPLTVTCPFSADTRKEIDIDNTLAANLGSICIQGREISSGDSLGVRVELCTYKGSIYTHYEKYRLEKK